MRKIPNLTKKDIQNLRETAEEIYIFIGKVSEVITDYTEEVRDIIKNNTKFIYQRSDQGFVIEMDMKVLLDSKRFTLTVPRTTATFEEFAEIFNNRCKTGSFRKADYSKITVIKYNNINYGEMEYLKAVYGELNRFITDYDELGVEFIGGFRF